MSNEQSNKPSVTPETKAQSAKEKLEAGIKDANNLVRKKKVDL